VIDKKKKETTLDNPDNLLGNVESTPTVPLDEIFKLRAVNGLPIRKIAQLVQMPKSTVHDYITRHNIPSQRALEAFKATRSDRFATIQRDIAESIGQDDYKKASLVQKTTAIATLYDKERLGRDQSTENVAMSIDDMDAETIAVMRKLARMVPDMLDEAEEAEDGGE